MRRFIFLMAGVICLSVAAWSQDAGDYQKTMKDIAATNAALGKDLAAKSADSVSDATKLGVLFAHVHDFWQQKDDADDAVKFAADAQAGFRKVSDLAAAAKWDDASAEAKSATANCMGCHGAHRQRQPDGSFTIK